MPQPVKPATNSAEIRPRLRGNSPEMWNCAEQQNSVKTLHLLTRCYLVPSASIWFNMVNRVNSTFKPIGSLKQAFLTNPRTATLDRRMRTALKPRWAAKGCARKCAE